MGKLYLFNITNHKMKFYCTNHLRNENDIRYKTLGQKVYDMPYQNI